MRLAWVCLLAACYARVPPLPSQGGPPWLELRTAHFVMWTDAPADRARELLEEMEHFRSILYGVAFPDLPDRGTSFVVAFRDTREISAYLPRNAAAMTLTPSEMPLGLPAIVISADDASRSVDAAHELTHALSHGVIHHQPRWFSEGIASYYQTIRLDQIHERVEVGQLPLESGRDFARVVVGRGLLPSRELFACVRRCSFAPGDEARFYATAWTLYAYLRNERPAQLAALERAFDDGPVEQAWFKAFPDLPPDKLDHALATWVAAGGIKIWSYRIALQHWPVESTQLGDADVHAVRAMLEPRSDALRDARAALVLDSTNILARAEEARLGKLPHVDVARTLVAAHPQSWVAWALLATALPAGPDRDAARARACTLAAANPAVSGPGYCPGTPRAQPP